MEGVSERYKDKHFVFERRLKTINSMNDKPESTKQRTSSVMQDKTEEED